MCLDQRSRKLIMAIMEQFLSVILEWGDNEKVLGRSNDHATLEFVGPDDCLISTSWDKSVRIFDEAAPGEGLAAPSLLVLY